MNPNAKIPTIDDDGVIVWESNAVVRYLAARHGADRLWDRDPGARAQADQWMDWMQTTLAPDFYELFWLSVRTPPTAKPNGHRRFRRRLRAHYVVVERQLADQLICWASGSPWPISSSAPHCIVTTRCHRTPGACGRPALVSAPDGPPAYRSHVMVSFADLRGNAVG